MIKFPENFLWGAGLSSLQHEGSPLADGATPSMMYEWAHTPGKVPPGGTFDTAADFYNRFRSDIALMRELGLQACNFETGWCRVSPRPGQAPNERGLDYYDQLVDEMLRAGITPLCNLYVFDHPQAVQDLGGWLNRDCASWFAEYASVVFDRLGDRVEYWTPICEIHILNHFSYLVGRFPPEGHHLTDCLQAMHHLLLGQGMAVEAFRASSAKGAIGNQHSIIPVEPSSSGERDQLAAKRVNEYFNLLVLNAQMTGAYPAGLVEWYGDTWPSDAIRAGDLEVISRPIDFIGLDYYFDMEVQFDEANTPGRTAAGQFSFSADAFSCAKLQAAVNLVPPTAQGMYKALERVSGWYPEIPLVLLEIGLHLDDVPRDGTVDDMPRIRYFEELLTGAHWAIEKGIDLRGCYVWSFLDGWEFNNGLSHRYGLVHVDDETQARTVKNSAYWYRDTIRNHGFARLGRAYDPTED